MCFAQCIPASCLYVIQYYVIIYLLNFPIFTVLYTMYQCHISIGVNFTLFYILYHIYNIVLCVKHYNLYYQDVQCILINLFTQYMYIYFKIYFVVISVLSMP